MNIVAPIVFVCSHPNAANHFADFAAELEKSQGITCQFLASGTALENLKKRQVVVQSFDPNDLSELVKTCRTAKAVITDVGHAAAAKIHQTLSEQAPEVRRFAYYDNPESCVPGGYSETVEQVAAYGPAFLFANANLEKVYAKPDQEIGIKTRIPLGYSPLPSEVGKLRDMRKTSQVEKRAQFLKANGIEERKQKIAVYIGGANTEYMNKAFPTFLKVVEGVNLDMTVVIKQHPRSLTDYGDQDGKLLAEWKKSHGTEVIISKADLNDLLMVADLALYYQTTANAKSVLLDIPTIQVERFDDTLVRNGICESVSTSELFLKAVNAPAVAIDQEKIYKLLGVRNNWAEILYKALTN